MNLTKGRVTSPFGLRVKNISYNELKTFKEGLNMNRFNRHKLCMTKVIRGSIVERFTMIVLTENLDKVKKEYESRGYDVRRIPSY